MKLLYLIACFAPPLKLFNLSLYTHHLVSLKAILAGEYSWPLNDDEDDDFKRMVLTLV